MMTSPPHDPLRAPGVDRLCELASIGAGHAAGALATLLGRPVEMSVPRAGFGGSTNDLAHGAGGDPRSWSGVFFEILGGPNGTLALLFPPAAREAVLAALLGAEPRDERQAASALSEVGNILVSHAVSAIGDTIGAVVLPSPPELALRDAPAELARRLRERSAADPYAPLFIGVELRDRAGVFRGWLVYVPELLG